MVAGSIPVTRQDATVHDHASQGTRSASARLLGAPLAGVTIALLIGFLGGCASDEKLGTPIEHRSPWAADRVWAVVPLANESGVSVVDTLGISDDFVAEVDAIDGISCVPLNRSIAAMRSLGLQSVRTDAEARALLRVLQVDGLVVGSITAYDPYTPLTLGVAAQLYTVDAPAPNATEMGELTMAVRETDSANRQRLGPSSQSSRVYDASNHDVLRRLAGYAAGRHNPKSGLREAVYTSSMDAYSRFVAYDVMGELLSTEFAKSGERAEVAERAAGSASEAK